MNNKTATLIGATGLIGNHLLDLLINDSAFSEIKILVRRPIKFDNPKVKVSVIDFNNEESFLSEISGSNIVFCAIGTTNKKTKGDKDKYREVDYYIPVTAAKLSLKTGCEQFIVVSAYGANSNSSNFYTSLKGEVEDTLSSLNIPSLSIFRPSLLLGDRQEFRLGEIFATFLMKGISFLLPSNLKAIKAYDVAKAMLKASKSNIKGTTIYHYKEIMNSIKE